MNALARGMLPLAAVAVASIELSGCFTSQPPLIGKEQADYSFKTIKMRDDQGKEVELTRDGDSYVFTELANGKVERNILLYKINENVFAAQIAEGNHAAYYFAKKDGNALTLQAKCDNLEDDELHELNLAFGAWPDPSCNLENLDALIRLGQSAAIWSRDTRKVEIITIE